MSRNCCAADAAASGNLPSARAVLYSSLSLSFSRISFLFFASSSCAIAIRTRLSTYRAERQVTRYIVSEKWEFVGGGRTAAPGIAAGKHISDHPRTILCDETMNLDDIYIFTFIEIYPRNFCVERTRAINPPGFYIHFSLGKLKGSIVYRVPPRLFFLQPAAENSSIIRRAAAAKRRAIYIIYGISRGIARATRQQCDATR